MTDQDMHTPCAPARHPESTLAPSSPLKSSPEQRVRELEQELIACERLATLGNLAAMVAHEFRNLMTPIVARCEAALGLDDEAFMRKTIERSLTQAQRATRVAQHLLEYAHDRPHELQPCSVAAAVAEAVETITRPFAKDGISLAVDVPDDLHVAAQPELLCQVLMNLLLNARQAIDGARGALAVRAWRNGEHALIEVRDDGKGFDRRTLEQVVNPFLAATPGARAGDWHALGLGLSVCRLIVQRHGGRMHATANDGPGCTFHVEWPLWTGRE